ncbi:hypothetical protein B296_00038658 [Ensete ventricosum]|uniref:Uncharacterized protein n=1 Tax=Ensete ventricosum TaxID=4639 RepID=A0A426XM98_ENSVE|nr:hypothetical protein B296_00038658 [Ensete ventricosum]
MSSASSNFESSRPIKVSARRSRVKSHPPGDSKSIVARPSSGGVAPDDSRAADALATIQSCFNVDSTLTSHRLVKVRERFYIPLKYELHVPISDQCPYDAFLSGFSLSIDALEMGVRFSLHLVIEACLDVRDMNETWLAEAGLSLVPRGLSIIFTLNNGLLALTILLLFRNVQLGKDEVGQRCWEQVDSPIDD